jgi:hypothetical protein
MSSKRLESTFGIAGILLLAMVCGACTRERPDRAQTGQADQPTADRSREAAGRDKALVRFVNANRTLSAADLWFGDQNAFSNVSYKAATAYQELPGERRTFMLRHAGQAAAEPLASNSEGLGDGDRHTVIAFQRNDGSAGLMAVNDGESVPVAGRALLRIVHAAPNLDEIDVVAAGKPNEKWFDGVNFSTATNYRDVDPVTVALDVRRENQQQAALHIPNVNLTAGRRYTIVLTGERGQAQFDSILLEDETPPSAPR